VESCGCVAGFAVIFRCGYSGEVVSVYPGASCACFPLLQYGRGVDPCRAWIKLLEKNDFLREVDPALHAPIQVQFKNHILNKAASDKIPDLIPPWFRKTNHALIRPA
jgi:hypothetical protein